jgi:hypothetical protein
MTKHVFNTSQCAHVWAQMRDPDDWGNSGGGNVSFRGRVLYSYNTAIARIVNTPTFDDQQPRQVVLLSSKSHSVSTSRHQREARSATRHMRQFTVPFIGVPGAWNRIDDADPVKMHAGNMEHFKARYDDEVKRFKGRAHLYLGYHYDEGVERSLEDLMRGRLAEMLQDAREYASAFGLEMPDYPVDADAAECAKIRAEREAKANTPEARAKRAKDRERREAKKEAERRAVIERNAARAAKLFSEWKAGTGTYRPRSWEYLPESPEHAELLAVETAEREERDRQRKLDEVSRRAEWLAGSLNMAHWRFDAECGGAALRVRGDTVETSWGADFPLSHGIKAFRFIKQRRMMAEAWERNGHTMRVGHFQVDRVTATGDIWASCHEIKWPEIERIARQVGAFDDAPSDAALEPKHSAA